MSKPNSIAIRTVERFLAQELDGVAPLSAWGEVSYFYNPGHRLKRGVYCVTIKQKDGEHDRASHIDRSGVWRLNIGLTKPVYRSLFGEPPGRPTKGGAISGPWDFTTLDQIMPHPIYAWMGWVCVLSPSQATWERCAPLIHAAHAKAKAAFQKRMALIGKDR